MLDKYWNTLKFFKDENFKLFKKYLKKKNNGKCIPLFSPVIIINTCDSIQQQSRYI